MSKNDCLENELSYETRDLHRALFSLEEELDAIDSYHQRVELCHDSELRAVFAHNRDEEEEHAARLIEWGRSKDPKFAKQIKGRVRSRKHSG